jgi:cytochrome c oxidase assembly protein subunit 11
MAMSGPAKTVAQTVSLVVFMGALAWASVPFYDWFCRVTGFGGVPGQVDVASDDILDQTIKVRFDGTLNDNMGWEFKPVQREMELRIGEVGLAFDAADHPSSRPSAGQAI